MVLCREAVDQVERYSLQLHSLQLSVFSWPHTPGVSTSSCPRSCASTAAGNALGNARMSANNRCIMNAARTLAWVENSAFPLTKINGLPEAVSTSPPLHRDEHRFDLVHVAKYRKLPVVSKELSHDPWSSFRPAILTSIPLCPSLKKVNCRYSTGSRFVIAFHLTPSAR